MFKVGDKVEVVKKVSLNGLEALFDEIPCTATVVVTGFPSGVIKVESGGLEQWVGSDQVVLLGEQRISAEDHIEEVMDEFDFPRVETVMKALEWSWWDAEDGVPSIAEMRRMVRRLMRACYDRAMDRKEDQHMGTGGFEVCYFYEGDVFEVDFVLTSWRTGNW